MTPDDRVIQKDWERELKDAKEYARKSMIVTINKEATEEQEDLNADIDRVRSFDMIYWLWCYDSVLYLMIL